MFIALSSLYLLQGSRRLVGFGMEFCDFADGLLLDGVAADRDLDGDLKDALVDGPGQDTMGTAQAFVQVFREVAGLSLKIGVPK
jgi:hypothetical protein